MLENRTINMSNKEIKRCEILEVVNEKQIIQREGARSAIIDYQKKKKKIS